MATIKKSLRLAQEVADKVSALKADGESESAAYARVIAAGVEALERGQADTSPEEAAADRGAGVADFRLTVEALSGQLEAKDRQIDRLQELLAQAHSLHRAEQERTAALALPEPKKGLGQRIREFFTGEKEQHTNQ